MSSGGVEGGLAVAGRGLGLELELELEFESGQTGQLTFVEGWSARCWMEGHLEMSKGWMGQSSGGDGEELIDGGAISLPASSVEGKVAGGEEAAWCRPGISWRVLSFGRASGGT